VSTPLPIYGVIAPTGVMLRARVRNPDGSTNTEVAMAEDGAGLGTYGGVGSVTTVTDTSGLPYTAEVRQVTAQTSGAFDASTTVRAARQPVDVGPPAVNVTQVNGGPATLDTGGGAGGTGTGTGDFAVDHNGGSGVTVDGAASTADVLRFTVGGSGVDDVEVVAYLKSDYDAGTRGAADRKGTTFSGSDGRWEAPLMLDPGTYTIVASVRGFLARAFTVVVP
jgi:hypothetical protein